MSFLFSGKAFTDESQSRQLHRSTCGVAADQVQACFGGVGALLTLFLLSDTAAPHTRRWARWFARRGHEVHVVSFNPNGLPGYEPATVHSVWVPRLRNSFPERILKTPIIFNRIRRLLNQYFPDVVHAHSAGGYAWMAMFCGFRPYVVTPWGTDLLIDVKRSYTNRWLTGQALRHAAIVTTDAFHFVDTLCSLGVPKERILVHTFGTDTQYFAPGQDQGEFDKLWCRDSPVVISTRTLNPVHDVEIFARALPRIHASFPSARFVIAGDGSDRRSLETLVGQLGMTSVTHFTGMVDEGRMCHLLRASTIYVSTSKMDAGLAASTAEAMAVGLPVVQTDNSDNAYWTPEGEGGFLFPNGDPHALASAVCRLLADPETCRIIGKRNREQIVNEYSMEKAMSQIEVMYHRVIAEYARMR